MYETFDRSPKGAQPNPARRYARLDASPVNHPVPAHAGRPAQSVPEWDALGSVDLPQILTWLRRGLPAIVALGVLGAAGGLGFGTFAKARYTTYADILIDPVSLQVVSDDLFGQNPQRDSQLLTVESKMRVLTSGNLLTRVVNVLELDRDPEFVGGEPLFSLPFLNSSSNAPEGDKTLAAVRSLSKRIEAMREERSFVVSLSVWAEDPNKAVLISNTMVTAFQAELAQAESDGAGRTAAILSQRVEELRASVAAAEQRVEDFRRDNGLQSSAGELISSQSLTQINLQVVEAQGRVIAAQARYDDLVLAQARGLEGASGVTSETVAALRAQYATIKQEIDSQAVVFGPRHPRTTALQPQLDSIANEIKLELDRLTAAARSDLDQARAVLDQLNQEAGDIRSSVSADSTAMVKLRELERDAEAQASVYQSFLVRAGQVAEREQIDTTNVRVISSAFPPEARSWPPRTMLLMMVGTALGIGGGAALACLFGFLALLKARRQE